MHHLARRKTPPTTELLRHAERNKVLVLLEFAEKTNAEEIVKAVKRKLQKVAEVAAEVHETLRGVEHVFIKLVGSFIVCKLLRRSVNCVIIVYNSSTYTFDQESFFCGDVLKEIFKNSIFS